MIALGIAAMPSAIELRLNIVREAVKHIESGEMLKFHQLLVGALACCVSNDQMNTCVQAAKFGIGLGTDGHA